MDVFGGLAPHAKAWLAVGFVGAFALGTRAIERATPAVTPALRVQRERQLLYGARALRGLVVDDIYDETSKFDFGGGSGAADGWVTLTDRQYRDVLDQAS